MAGVVIEINYYK